MNTPEPTLTRLDQLITQEQAADTARRKAITTRNKLIARIRREKTTPITEITKATGLTRQHVTRILREHGIPNSNHTYQAHTTKAPDLTKLTTAQKAVTDTTETHTQALATRDQEITHLITTKTHTQAHLTRHTGISTSQLKRILSTP